MRRGRSVVGHPTGWLLGAALVALVTALSATFVLLMSPSVHGEPGSSPTTGEGRAVAPGTTDGLLQPPERPPLARRFSASSPRTSTAATHSPIDPPAAEPPEEVEQWRPEHDEPVRCVDGYCDPAARDGGADLECEGRSFGPLCACSASSAPCPCTADDQCTPGGRCERGQCTLGTRECRGDGDCDEDERCVDGVCAAGARECEADPDCGQGARCTFGICGVGARECRQDRQCGDDARCVGGLCGDGARQCHGDRHCEPGERCVYGLCLEGERECAADGDCGAEARCNYGTCAPGARQCTWDQDCAVGSRCEHGSCEAEEREAR